MERTPLTPREAVELVLNEQGRKLTWLAARVGTNRTSLHLMLIGERGFSDDMRARIARELGVPLAMLFLSESVRSTERTMLKNEPEEGTAA